MCQNSQLYLCINVPISAILHLEGVFLSISVKTMHFTLGDVSAPSHLRRGAPADFAHFRTAEYGDMVRENLNKIGKLMGNPFEKHTIYVT